MNRENVEDIYPLSPVQQGMLFHSLYAPASGVYFVQLTFAIDGHLDVGLFRRSWQMAVQRHTALRTGFMWEGLDHPLQIVFRQVELPWEEYDWRGLAEDQVEERLQGLLMEERGRPFDLSRAPLMRVALIRSSESLHRVVWNHHHIALDGWSSAVVLKEVLANYESLSSVDSPALARPRPYRDYIAWLQRQDSVAADGYWRSRLRGFRSPTALGIERPEAPGPDDIREHRHCLSADLTGRVQSFARRHQLTINTMTQAAWGLLLSRYGGSEDVVFGVTVSGRPAELPGADGMVGMFINTLPLRVRTAAEDRVLPWLKRIQAEQADMLTHQASSLVKVQSVSEVGSGHSLFHSIVVFENYPVDSALVDAGTRGRIRDVRGIERTHYPLTLFVVPGAELTLRIGFDARRFESGVVDRMLGHLCALLERMSEASDRPVGELELLTQPERHELLCEFNCSCAGLADDCCVHHLFEAQARRTPGAVAVVFEGQALSYRDLDARANRLARHLEGLGVGPEVLVGICVERSLEMVVGILGVLKAGGAYVPLDPAFPRQRLEMIWEDARPAVLLTQERLAVQSGLTGARVVLLDADGPAIARLSEEPFATSVAGSHSAYVIYTSGSTGLPKGVVVEHRAVVNFLRSMAKAPGMGADDVLAAVTTLSFDIAALEMFLPLVTGGQVVLVGREAAADPAQLIRILDEHRVTVMQATPATWRMLVDSKWQGRSGLRILCGGEALPRDLASSLQAAGRELWNMYGPTETTIWSSVWRVARGDGLVSIGRPIANTRVYILDRRLSPVPVGVVGELCIGGLGLARGYLHRPDLTAERFVPDAFDDRPGARMYRTGDLARYLPNGEIEVLGRMDHQVKIRGFRIELGEIESRLREHPLLSDAAVVAQEEQGGGNRLVAYLVPRENAAPGAAEMRSFVGERLPDYMIPSVFVRLAELPLTPNGKVDRKALPASEVDRTSTGCEYVAPRDEIERRVAEIWASLLGARQVGVHDSFFALGGHSLLATRLTSRLRETFRVDLSLRTVFETPTVAGQADRIRAGARSDEAMDVLVDEVEEGRI